MKSLSLLSTVQQNWRYVIPTVRKLGYVGWLENGFRNLGDQAMYLAFQKMFNQFAVLPYKITKKTDWFEKKIFRKKIFEAVFLGGGTLINSPGSLVKLQSALTRYSPVFIFGSGVKDPEFWDHRIPGENCMHQWVDVLNKCAYVGVRGPLSLKVLEEHGFKNTQITGDPALYWARSAIKKKKGNKRLGLNVGLTNGKIWGYDKTVMEFTVRLVNVLQAEGWDITFFVVWPKDLPIITDILKRLGHTLPVFHAYRSLEKALHFMENECDIMIGEKLHSIILSYCTFTPSIMLEYQPKCRDFMMSMDMEQFGIRTDKLSMEHILNNVHYLSDNIEAMQVRIRGRVDYFKHLQLETRNLIVSAIAAAK